MKSRLKSFKSVFSKTEIAVLPGQIAFFLTLSIIPMIALLGMLASFIPIESLGIAEFIKTSFPMDISEYLEILLNKKENFFLFFLITFVIASNGTHSIMVASNTLFGKEKEIGYFARRIKAFFLLVLLLLLFLFIFLVPAFGDKIIAIYEASKFYTIDMNVIVRFIYLILKWPMTFFFILFTIKIIFTIAPDKKIASKFVTPGSLLTTFMWIFGTGVYSFYINNIARYDLFYGGLSNIVILMLWIYFLSFALVLGMAVNQNYIKKLDEKGIINKGE